MAYQEQQTRSATHSTVLDLINDSSILTVDENVFCDALRCIYFLCKNEIAHTTNFSGLKALCIQLGNETLPLLRKSGNTNYEAIGWTLEEQILCEVKNSPFYSVTLDEATDISVIKQLGLCIQYIDSTGNIQVRSLKLLEVTNGTADVLTDAIVSYLTSTAPATLDISRLAGGATDGASVMVGHQTGMVTQLKKDCAYVYLRTLQCS